MLYEITVPQFTKMLTNLSRILDKGAGFADSKKIYMEVLLNARLAPDQFNLLKQIQIATDSAKLCAFRLTGKEAPIHDDKEKTLGELKTRIEQTLTYLKSLKPDDFKGAEDRKVSQPRWEGKWLTSTEFVIQHAIPNVYFHITTAYAILRHNGVEVGKKDYLGEMPFKQP
ncbi:MAG: DUF1993 domain-containing protein [Bdellovibrionaceae bacterium]|nr:DUF1993 domain-containing protein [Pseudobdellovibrionaceae bacterium]